MEEIKVWIFQSNKTIEKSQLELIQIALDEFIKNWTAHGAKLYAGYEIIEDRFIKVYADESKEKASGCSIDAMTQIIKKIESNLKTGLLNRMFISYENKEGIQTKLLPEFKKLIQKKQLTAEDYIYDISVSNQKEFLNRFKIKIKDSWAKTYLD
ncbi:MAG: hypothetical protein H6604_08525 [Flavobacteriales bacterium]|nr:hypothetical protein [Flavobacteriales bacterium]